MYRIAIEKLLKWKQSKRRKPLIIEGARQVGKTWLMKEFGKQAYTDAIYINFDSNSRMAELFASDLDTDRLIMGLELYAGRKIDPDNSLLIFDEVQEVPRALASLKYFYENAPQYHIVCAGSLLGIALHQGTSFPVGKVDFLKLYPLSFKEFLMATDKERFAELLDKRDGLMCGICNGFQALVKSGLLPYGRLGCVTKDSPTLFRNDINRHVSQIVTTRVASTASPWLSSFSVGDLHSIAVSHGEGKFVVGEQLARRLFERGQVAFQYAGPDGHATAEAPCNPNGSFYAIEGIVSEDGRILGKMGHTERYGENLFKNICGEKRQPIFENAVAYFRKRN